MQMEKCQKLPSPHFHPCLSLSHRHGKLCLSDATIYDMQLIMIMSHDTPFHPQEHVGASWRDQLSYLWPSYHHIISYHMLWDMIMICYDTIEYIYIYIYSLLFALFADFQKEFSAPPPSGGRQADGRG